MGLLDVLNGMQNGPRGQTDPNAKGGVSPIGMAILALLAYKAYKKMTGGASPAPASPSAPPSLPPGGTINAGLPGGLGGALGGALGGGGLGGLLKGGLGGLLAGGAAGTVLSGGLNDLLKQFQDAGHGETANSWVSPGENKQISSNDLANALGADQINALTQQTGLSREELLEGLSQQLPDVINQLTPHGRLPTEQEASHWL
jgi:uncharacterized protein YidB (DUF937 family)